MTDGQDTGAPPSCEDAREPAALSVAEAHARIAGFIEPVAGSETVELRASLDRVLARDQVSPINIPSATNSAMDGYALHGSALDADGRARLRMVGTAWAGHPLGRALAADECARIMTGAAVPDGADTVIMQERSAIDGDFVTLHGGEPGANVRAAGEDLAIGDLALAAGTRIRPAELGVLASLGLTRIEVCRRPVVALFATGDEITEPGQPLAPGRLYDSNRYTVHALLTRAGAEVDDRGHLPDDRDAVEASLLAAAADADAVVTTGGVSVGAADHVGPVLREAGDISFWQLTMKPGRPLNFGRLGGALFFGLPGNPVSAMVTGYQFVQPAVRRLAGEPYRHPRTFRARVGARLEKKPGRMEFQRGVLSTAADGQTEVRSVGPQGSGRLTSMARADCLIVLAADAADVEAGEWVDVQPFEGLV